MTALKKTAPNNSSAYKLAAAERRSKVASMSAPIVGEVKPSQMQVDWVKQYSIPESEQAEDNSEGLPGPLGGLTRGAEGAPDPGQTGAGQRGPSGV